MSNREHVDPGRFTPYSPLQSRLPEPGSGKKRHWTSASKALREQIDPLKEARDAAKKRLGDFNTEAIRNLEQLHGIKRTGTRRLSLGPLPGDCVERRRGRLTKASAAGGRTAWNSSSGRRPDQAGTRAMEWWLQVPGGGVRSRQAVDDRWDRELPVSTGPTG